MLERISAASGNLGTTLPLLAMLMTVSGCWSEVEFEPDQEPVAESPSPPESPQSELGGEENTPSTGAAGAPESPAEEPTPPAAEPSPKPTEDRLTFEELFGTSDDEESDESSPAAAPPDGEAPAIPPEESLPPEEVEPQKSMPRERDALTPAPTTPSVGDRYAMPLPSAEATVPATPAEVEGFTSPAPPITDADSTPPSDETPIEGVTGAPATTDERPTDLLPWDKPADVTPVEPAPTDAQPAEPKPIAVTPFEPVPTEEPVSDSPRTFADLLPEAPTATPETEEPEPPTPVRIDPTNTRHVAWLLGSKWSLMVLGEHRGAPEEERLKWFDQCQSLARSLGVELPTTPPSAASQPTAAFVEKMLAAGRELGAAIGAKHGTDDMALFEVAMKSNLPLVLDDSRPDLLPAIAHSVTVAAQRADLPNDLAQPYAQALSDSPSPQQIEQSVYDFHRAVEAQLAQ